MRIYREYGCIFLDVFFLIKFSGNVFRVFFILKCNYVFSNNYLGII